MKPSAKKVRALLTYCPLTGIFLWKVSSGRAVAGARAGCIVGGYLVIRIDRKAYKAHRLAWLYMNGRWPRGRLDHKDGDGANNRWGNIRRATHSQNMANRKVNRNNSSGLKGVCFMKANGRYAANVNKSGRRFYLGLYDTAELAHAAYQAKSNELFGEFARAA